MNEYLNSQRLYTFQKLDIVFLWPIGLNFDLNNLISVPLLFGSVSSFTEQHVIVCLWKLEVCVSVCEWEVRDAPCVEGKIECQQDTCTCLQTRALSWKHK